MAVGEEPSMQPRRRAPSNLSKNLIVGGMSILGVCLVVTLGHVRQAAHEYGRNVAQHESMLAQQLLEQFERDHPMGESKPHTQELVQADPLSIAELSDAEPMQQLLQLANRRKEDVREGGREKLADTERAAEHELSEPAAEDPAESSEPQTTDLADATDMDLDGSTEQQLRQLDDEMDRLSPIVGDSSATVEGDADDSAVLATHQARLEVLKQMAARTAKAIEQRKHKMLVKSIASELAKQLGAAKLSAPLLPVSLYEDDEEDLNTDSDITQQLAAVQSADSAAVTTTMLHSLVDQAKSEVLAELGPDTHGSSELDMLSSHPRKKLMPIESTPTQELAMLRGDDLTSELETKAADAIVHSIEHEVLAAHQAHHEPTQLAAVSKKVTEAPLAPLKTPKPTLPSKAPPAASPEVVVTHSSMVAEDELAKRVAGILAPTIGAHLTAKIMQNVEKDIERDEKGMSLRIESIAKAAAKESFDKAAATEAAAKAAEAAAAAKQPKVVTTVVHSPSTSTVTTIHGPASEVDKAVSTTVSGAVGSPVEVVAKPIHIDDDDEDLAEFDQSSKLALKRIDHIAENALLQRVHNGQA